jgi:Flp pilus assembly protein TadG
MTRGSVGQRRRRAARSDSGMVSAELALAIPALVAVVAALIWLVGLGMTQGAVAQAAREGARAAARGEPAPVVRAAARAVVPGAEVAIRRSGATVTVITRVTGTPPIRWLAPLRRELRAAATTWWEEQ